MSLSRGGVYTVDGKTPKIADDVFIAPGAVVAGDVEIGPGCSIWFNAVIRGDVAPIRIGARTNVQDNAVLHIDRNAPCILGDDVTIGHGAIVHGTTIGNGVTVGMGAVVLSRSRVGDGAIIAAGAVVAEDAVVPPRALMMGVPAKERREVTEAEDERMRSGTSSYVENGRRFAETLAPIGEDA